jgi:trigger factor
MEISFSREKNNTAVFTFSIPAEDVREKQAEIVRSYQQSLNIKGFRKGKIPEDVVRRHVGDMTILEEAVERMIPDLLDEGMRKYDVEIYGHPDVRLVKIAPGQPVELTATFTPLPKVALNMTTGLDIASKKPTTNPEDVDRSLKELQRMYAKEKKVLRGARKGDKVPVTFNSYLDKIPLEGGKAEKHPVVIGESAFVPGFEDRIIGIEPGEKREFTLRFPKDYHRKNIADRDVEFSLKADDVFEIEIPELNDAFAKQVGQFASLSELRKKIEDNLLEEATQKEQQRFEIAMLKALCEKNEFEPIPDVMIADESERMLHELEHSVTNQGGKFDDYLSSIKKTKEQMKAEFKEKAIERIKTAILLRAIAEKERLFASDDDIRNAIESDKKRYANLPDALKQMETPQYKRHTAHALTSQNVIRYLRERNTKPETKE